jgi:hypothetical protein
MKKAIIIMGLMAFSSCSTIFSENEYGVTITSSPEQARFTVYDEDNQKLHSGRTPARVSLEASNGYFSKAKYTVKYEKLGYITTTSNINAKLGSSYFANVLGLGFGIIVGGLIVDPATGNMWYLPKFTSGNMSEVETVEKIPKQANKKNI